MEALASLTYDTLPPGPGGPHPMSQEVWRIPDLLRRDASLAVHAGIVMLLTHAGVLREHDEALPWGLR
ncbi:MAG: hypothetical protein C0514_08780 [Candidatus Puniceispirillum sp.]|nr:hypothetical protein [Candidatus Puniceispirillum sp.]